MANNSSLFNSRFVAIALLSFSSGLPLLLTSTTLQAWFTTTGIGLHTIGLLSLVGLPYVFKFLWAPLLDHFGGAGFGRRRSWIFVMQLCLAVLLLLMSLLSPKLHASWLAFLALGVALSSATQDTAIDAYRTEILQQPEFGIGAAINTFGYYLAMLVAGALALIMAQYWGWRLTYFIMALLVFALALLTLVLPRAQQLVEPVALREAVLQPVVEFLSRPRAYWILLFIVWYKLSDALSFSLNPYFLLHQLHFSLLVVGSVAKVVWMAALLLGTFLGGWGFRRLGLFRSLFYFGALQVASILLYVWLAAVGKNIVLMVLAIFFEKFSAGISIVAFVALLMALCDLRYTATQFALFSALAALPRVLVGPVAASLVAHWGWVNFYLACFCLGLPALCLLFWLRPRVKVLNGNSNNS